MSVRGTCVMCLWWAVPGEGVSGCDSPLPFLGKFSKEKKYKWLQFTYGRDNVVYRACLYHFSCVSGMSIIPRYVNRVARNASHHVTARVFETITLLQLNPMKLVSTWDSALKLDLYNKIVTDSVVFWKIQKFDWLIPETKWHSCLHNRALCSYLVTLRLLRQRENNPQFSGTYKYRNVGNYKFWMLILVLWCENERQRWDASRYIKARSEA